MMCEAFLHLGRTVEALTILSEASTWDPRFLLVQRALDSGDKEKTLIELRRIRPS